MQPAVDAIEEWGRKTFGGRAKADGQEEHDRWLQSQPDSQVKTLARNLTDLMRAKDGSSARIRVPDKFPDGCKFVASFSGDEFVAFPDGKVFKASDDGEMLIPTGGLPERNAAPMSEAGFVGYPESRVGSQQPGIRLLDPSGVGSQSK